MSQVYVVRDDGLSVLMDRLRCSNEGSELQRLLANNFDLLPGDQIEPDDPRRWVLVKREMPVPDPATGNDRWNIDFFFVDQDATPTFVECKRFADTRSRREVVGQMLEYAANGHHYWTAEVLRELSEQTARESGRVLDQVLEELHPTDDLQADDFFQKVQENLRQGQLRIIFFLEESPFELRSVVDFLNKQMERSEVLLVEARLYTSGDRRIVVPVLFGYTEQARLVKRAATVSSTTSGRHRWDKETFFADAGRRLSDGDVQVVKRVHDAAIALGCELSWGSGEKKGSFNVKDAALCQRSLFSVYSNGRLSLNFGWLHETERVEAMRDRFIALAIEKLGLPAADYRDKYQYVRIDDWRGRGEAVTDVLKVLITEFRLPNPALEPTARVTSP